MAREPGVPRALALPQADPATIHLSPGEKEWLVKMAADSRGQVSLLMDKPPKRTMNSLVAKGMAQDIMGTFWKITELGQQHC